MAPAAFISPTHARLSAVPFAPNWAASSPNRSAAARYRRAACVTPPASPSLFSLASCCAAGGPNSCKSDASSSCWSPSPRGAKEHDAPVAIPNAGLADFFDADFKAGLLAAARFVVIGGPIEFQNGARHPDRDTPIIADPRRQLAHTSRPYSFRRSRPEASHDPGDRSATIFFSFAFSSSGCFSRRISGGCMPSYFFFQLK
jgi:hypothetical protein